MRPEAKAFLWTVSVVLVMAAAVILQARLIAPKESASPPAAETQQQLQFQTGQKIATVPVVTRPLSLIIPVEGVIRENLVDTWAATRGEGRTHKGIDIMAPAGTPVLAAAPGRISKFFFSERGGITIYQADETGRFTFYYAHLQGYESGLREGDSVHQGQRLGFVGQTGNATTPHLHFEIENASDDGKWWRGNSFNPYPSLIAGRVLIQPTPDG